MNQQYKEVFDEYNSVPKESQDLIDAMFDGQAKAFIKSCEDNYKTNELNKNNLNDYFTTTECQAFTKLSEDSKDAKIRVIESVMDVVAGATKRHMLETITHFNKLIEFAEELYAELSKLGTTPKLEQEKKKLQAQKDILDDCENRLKLAKGGFEIGIIKEVWNKMEKLDWKGSQQK